MIYLCNQKNLCGNSFSHFHFHLTRALNKTMKQIRISLENKKKGKEERQQSNELFKDKI